MNQGAKPRRGITRVVLTASAELWGLFVDDGMLACALVAWCCLAILGLPALGVERALRAPLLLAGCLVTLVIDVLATALRRRALGASSASQ
jgi:hypothetical protein